MARRSQESFQKRAREKARQEKQAIKRAKREDSPASDEESISRSEEDKLMQDFAKLSARYEAGQISSDQFDEERQRIFSELGLENFQ
jgi:hypothetical protein